MPTVAVDDLPRHLRWTGISPVLRGAGDFDLELLESRTLDGHTQELVYRRTPR